MSNPNQSLACPRLQPEDPDLAQEGQEALSEHPEEAPTGLSALPVPRRGIRELLPGSLFLEMKEPSRRVSVILSPDILEAAGVEVELGTLTKDPAGPFTVYLGTGRTAHTIYWCPRLKRTAKTVRFTQSMPMSMTLKLQESGLIGRLIQDDELILTVADGELCITLPTIQLPTEGREPTNLVSTHPESTPAAA